MFVRSWLPRSLTRSLLATGAILAIGAQLCVAFASLAEAREGAGMGAHVEQSGTSTHYAHSDACAICQARSLHGLAVRVPEAVPDNVIGSTAIDAVGGRIIAADLFSPRKSRAPPSRS